MSPKRFLQSIGITAAASVASVQFNPMLARGAEDLDISMPAPAAVIVKERDSRAPIPMAMKTNDVAAKGEAGKDAGSDSYLTSLQKEKLKQGVNSGKSKSQRSKDLCEQLGRGC